VTAFGPPLRINGRPPDGYWLGGETAPDRRRYSRRPCAAAIPHDEESAITAFRIGIRRPIAMWPPQTHHLRGRRLLAQPRPNFEVAIADGGDRQGLSSIDGRDARPAPPAHPASRGSPYGCGIKGRRVRGPLTHVRILVGRLDGLHRAEIPAFGKPDLDRRRRVPSPRRVIGALMDKMFPLRQNRCGAVVRGCTLFCKIMGVPNSTRAAGPVGPHGVRARVGIMRIAPADARAFLADCSPNPSLV